MISGKQPEINILLVEDNPGDAVLVEKHLQTADTTILADKINLTHNESLDEAFDTLDEELVDIILLDLGLPRSSGIETLERVLDDTIEYPIIVLTGLDDGDAAVQAIQQGAQDYLPKDNIDGDMLVRAMRYAIERKENQLELKRQNERLDNFANVVSHDLRNPLDIARGYSDMAQKKDDVSHLDTVDDALNRMNDMIDDVLTLARQGDSVDETEEIDFSEIIKDAWETVDTKDCVLETPEDFPAFEADRSRLRQQLENLFRNSVTHAGEDVTITVGWLDEDYGFYVKDNGPGIPDDNKDELFDQGFTTDSEGTGFGLNIVEQIAEAHGWDIRVLDGNEGGARFEVYNITSSRSNNGATNDE